MTSDDESIFPNQSVSQIAQGFDASSSASNNDTFNSQAESTSIFKSIGEYLIIENNLNCLTEAKNHLAKVTHNVQFSQDPTC